MTAKPDPYLDAPKPESDDLTAREAVKWRAERDKREPLGTQPYIDLWADGPADLIYPAGYRAPTPPAPAPARKPKPPAGSRSDWRDRSKAARAAKIPGSHGVWPSGGQSRAPDFVQVPIHISQSVIFHWSDRPRLEIV